MRSVGPRALRSLYVAIPTGLLLFLAARLARESGRFAEGVADSRLLIAYLGFTTLAGLFLALLAPGLREPRFGWLGAGFLGFLFAASMASLIVSHPAAILAFGAMGIVPGWFVLENEVRSMAEWLCRSGSVQSDSHAGDDNDGPD